MPAAQTARVYLDHAATTPMLAQARAAMWAAFDCWSNPSSPHAEGRAARAALEEARGECARLLGWEGEVIFTGGASEALRIALTRHRFGATLASAVEHDAVLSVVPDATRIPVIWQGDVDPEALGPALRRAGGSALVAVQAVNSETGVLQPVGAIAEAVHLTGGAMLVDCAQSAGKFFISDTADMAVISAHKFGGPPGVGALLLRDFAMLDADGGQERGYRRGTENLPGIAGMVAALRHDPPGDDGLAPWVRSLMASRFHLDMLVEEEDGYAVCGPSFRSPLIASYYMPHMPAAAQLIRFDTLGFAVSAGSACSSGTLKPSHVLEALAIPPAEAANVIRVSFGRSTTRAEVEAFGAAWQALAREARARAA